MTKARMSVKYTQLDEDGNVVNKSVGYVESEVKAPDWKKIEKNNLYLFNFLKMANEIDFLLFKYFRDVDTDKNKVQINTAPGRIESEYVEEAKKLNLLGKEKFSKRIQDFCSKDRNGGIHQKDMQQEMDKWREMRNDIAHIWGVGLYEQSIVDRIEKDRVRFWDSFCEITQFICQRTNRKNE